MSTILEIASDVADELSLIRPNTLSVTSTDPTAQKLFRQLTKTCRMLAGRFEWQALRKERTFLTVAATAQNGVFPTDFLRLVERSVFNRTKRRPLNGPMTPQEWQSTLASAVTPIVDQFYIRGSQLLITPTPVANQDIYFEYITKAIGTDATGVTPRERFTEDTDVTYFDDELVTLGMIWRYRKAEGLDYSEEFREYEMRYADVTKMDGGRRRLDMNEPSTDRTPNIPGRDIDYFVTVS